MPLTDTTIRPAERTDTKAVAAARPGCSRVEWTADRDNDTALAFYRALGHEELTSKVMYRLNSASEQNTSS